MVVLRSASDSLLRHPHEFSTSAPTPRRAETLHHVGKFYVLGIERVPVLRRYRPIAVEREHLSCRIVGHLHIRATGVYNKLIIFDLRGARSLLPLEGSKP